MLTVRDIAALSDLDLRVVGGEDGLANEVTWLHVSELADPTEFLEGGEFLLTTGLGVADRAESQRTYVARLARHRLAGLGFGVGFGFAEVPRALVREADRLGFPVVSIPYEVPFVAITKAALTHLANEELERLTHALEVHERLAAAVLGGRGVDALLAIVSNHLGCSVSLVDDAGRSIGERHARKRLAFEDALELPVTTNGEIATLKAAREARPFEEYDRLVLHHGQSALAFELSRRNAVSAAELRLAGDLLDDLECGRLEDREIERRVAAFGLEPQREYAALLALPQNGLSTERLRREMADELDRSLVPYLSTARRDRAAFLVGVESEDEVYALATRLSETEPDARIGIGRPGQGRSLGRSLLEARASLEAVDAAVASYHDLGSLELLLGLPDAALEAFVDRVLGPAAQSEWLMESLTALLAAGCRWSDAAERLGVHRHTLRYRMDRLREQAGRHPDEPDERMELWLAVKAHQALAARGARSAA
ncbi:MAG: PucR family transcriptional regulator ligand-binding domain-containing protein [Actinomycetota bacterium]|nr:PucR family transcriptional regulator ligand-binding domain-containing protein [Actinomycetota bacterium]